MVRRVAVLAALLGSVLALSGCMPHMTVAQMKEQMPKRPAELDRLDPFVGKWQSEGEARFAMLDQPLKISETAEYKWDKDKWFVSGQGVMKMEEMPDAEGQELWTYDVHAKKYRGIFMLSMGMTGIGEVSYDAKADTWHMSGVNHEPWGKACVKGTIHFRDKDTFEWDMKEYMWLTKTLEMTGTAKRVK
jgi:hypothetical protein